MDVSQRMAAYRRQNGRLTLTRRQYRQVQRIQDRQVAQARRASLRGTVPTPRAATR